MNEKNLAAPCGMYCGTCRPYLILKKNLFEEKGRKRGCKGCRIRNKNCSFIKRDCALIRKNEIDFCFECDSFPCSNLQKVNDRYTERFNISFIQNLKRIQKIGFEEWLKEQENLYRCPDCGGEICVHDTECFDCGKTINPNLK
jgi:hypothetical protein